jgi:hypothetical protein
MWYSLLDRFNQAIPSQIPRASSTSEPTPTPTPSVSSSKHSGLSGGEIAAAVVVPVVFLIALAAFLFWFFRRRRRGRTQAQEMGTDRAAVAPGDVKELPGTDPSKELQGSSNYPPREMDATTRASELPSPRYQPAELA